MRRVLRRRSQPRPVPGHELRGRSRWDVDHDPDRPGRRVPQVSATADPREPTTTRRRGGSLMQPQRRGLRRVYTPVLAGLVAAAGLGAGTGLTMSPAPAAAPLAVSLVVSTPETGAAANTLYVGQPVSYKATVT